MTTDMLHSAGFVGYVDVFADNIPANIFAEIIGERNRRCKIVADSLASAFGGRSQVSAEDIGRAVAGQCRNNGLGCYGAAAELIAAVYDATLYQGDDHYPPDGADYDSVMPEAVAAYDLAGGPDGLPRKHYIC